MASIDPVRVWKDPEYRESLSREELADLPEHPAGMLALRDEDLRDVSGGLDTIFSACSISLLWCFTKGCTAPCTGIWPIC